MEAVIDAFLILAREAEVEPLSEHFDVREVVAHEVARVQPLLAGRPIELAVIDEGAPRLYAPPPNRVPSSSNIHPLPQGSARRCVHSGQCPIPVRVTALSHWCRPPRVSNYPAHAPIHYWSKQPGWFV